MYAGNETPGNPSENDSASVELGVEFHVSQAGAIVGARFYKGKSNTGQHTATLWSATGNRLATGTFSGESSSGWQTLMFSTPVAVTPGVNYVVSYHASVGRYAQQMWQFNDGQTIGNSIIQGTEGVYHYGATTAFPQDSWAASAYYVDALFQAGGSGSSGTTPPTSTPPTSKPPTTPPTSKPPTTPPTSKPPTTPPTTPPPTSTGSTVPPNATSWPSASTTGVPAGTQLTAHSGDITVTTAGTVIKGMDVSGCINVRAANVTIIDTRVRGNCNYVVGSYSTGLTIEDSEVDGMNSAGASVGIGYAGFTALRVNVHGSQDGINANGNVVVQDSWVHDLNEYNGSHNDGIQITEGSNIVLKHNRIENHLDETSAIMVGADQGNVSNVTVDSNLLAGGGYSLYGGEDPPAGNSIASIVLSNNAFTTEYYPNGGAYGPVTARNDSQITFTGNHWYETGKAIN